MESSSSLEAATDNSKPQGMKTWFSKFLQQMKVANIKDTKLSTEEEDEPDPISLYLKNRVIIPLYLNQVHTDFHAISPQRKSEMQNRAQQDCQWTEKGVIDGFNVTTAEFPWRKWSISYQLEDESRAIVKRTWILEHPEYKRYAEGRMPDITEEEDTIITTDEDEATDVATCSQPVHLGSTPVEICYNQQILHKFIIQRYLKEVTNLLCIPEVHSIHAWIGSGPEIINGRKQRTSLEELSWIIEESIDGAKIKVEQNLKKTGSARIYYRESSGEWKRLRGRAKERFLDDLARIQVSYSFITFPYLGVLSLKQCSMNEDSRIPLLRLDDRVGAVKVDIDPFFASSSEESDTSSTTFINSTTSTTSTDSEENPLPGPYPLQPILSSWEHILVNPETGNITQLGYSERAMTVLWEVAALPPLRLSNRARERWVHSLKRHWFGCYVRNRQGGQQVEMPRLDQLCKWKD